MADCNKLVPFILKWEGGYSEDKTDRGNKNNGCTNKGITLDTYRTFYGKDKNCNDLKKISTKEWIHIFKFGFWNKCKADDISSQSVANIIVDWLWGSGITSIKHIQRIVSVDDDGVVGEKTIEAINKCNPKALFLQIKAERTSFYNGIVKNHPEQKKYLKGWMNRLNDIKFI